MKLPVQAIPVQRRSTGQQPAHSLTSQARGVLMQMAPPYTCACNAAGNAIVDNCGGGTAPNCFWNPATLGYDCVCWGMADIDAWNARDY
jgi:hypothetical protein